MAENKGEKKPNGAPYKIVLKGGKFEVVNNLGEVKGTHKTRDEALAHQAALYRNVPGAAKVAERKTWTGTAKRRTSAATPIDFEVEPDSGLPFHDFREKTQSSNPNLTLGCALCGFATAAPVHRAPTTKPADDAPVAHTLDGSGIDVAAEHTGTMVALFPPADVAKKIALDDQDAEPENDLHVTLVYLPDGPGDKLDLLHQIVSDVAAAHAPLTGKLGGIGHFNPSETSDNKPVAYAPVDVPRLSALREHLAETLSRSGFRVADNHGFTPHMTLKYAKHDAHVPDTPVSFDHVSVAAGDNRKHFPMAKQTKVHIQITDRTPEQINVAATPAEEKAFFTEVNNRTFITAKAYVVPASFEKAQSPNSFMKYMAGRFVGAEEPNRNGAFWSTGDLEFGLPTVAHGPLNWLHEARHVIGTITAADLVTPTSEQAADGQLPHIQAMAGMWNWIYPDEVEVIEQAAMQNKLYYSMECVSNEIACVGDGGCGAQVPYLAYLNNGAGTCVHMQQRAGASRRLVEPTFLGGAVIVPPVRPGWADAHATVMQQASGAAEKAHDSTGNKLMTATEWESLMATIYLYAGVTE